MPIGVIVNALSVVIGGAVGAVAGNKLSMDFKDKLNMIFGACSMGMGISTIVLMKNMPAVIFSVIIGTAIGLAIHFGDKINVAAAGMQKLISKVIKVENSNVTQDEFIATLVTCIVLFCASGTGIYGSIVSGMTGDHSILIAKSILDLFTGLIFACTLGAVVCVVAIPQFIIFFILFLLAGFIYPMTNETMIADFKACGGFIMLATGFRMIKVKMFPVADMIPSMIIVMPLSAFWVSVVLPLVS
ncbi:MAG: DUF554 domain-containing protein [Pseudobutyrivibrio ruminis]|uniref:DUF554 domain-containing protein n=1 Tax=Pseudobutyrivibrio ruminis TaxID=46206 RepID=UPI0026EF7C16|nr:DUF554 domain-containing protein [Pseudobutyrivibrio ruminis]MBE5914530.1 DUF554 domain-containing protein [Pseudobutyrivibrio ruminis]